MFLGICGLPRLFRSAKFLLALKPSNKLMILNKRDRVRTRAENLYTLTQPQQVVTHCEAKRFLPTVQAHNPFPPFVTHNTFSGQPGLRRHHARTLVLTRLLSFHIRQYPQPLDNTKTKTLPHLQNHAIHALPLKPRCSLGWDGAGLFEHLLLNTLVACMYVLNDGNGVSTPHLLAD